MKKDIQNFLIANFWIINLATLAAMAYLLATGTSELVATEILASLPEHPHKPKDRLKYQPHIHSRLPSKIEKKSGLPILERNIFDSVTGPIDPDGKPERIAENEETETETTEIPLVPCDNAKFKLLATVVSDRKPQRSFASISEGKEKILCRIGDQAGHRVVSWISWRYLFLKGAEDLCFIDIFGKTNIPPMKIKKRPTRKSRQSKRARRKKSRSKRSRHKKSRRRK